MGPKGERGRKGGKRREGDAFLQTPPGITYLLVGTGEDGYWRVKDGKAATK